MIAAVVIAVALAVAVAFEPGRANVVLQPFRLPLDSFVCVLHPFFLHSSNVVFTFSSRFFHVFSNYVAT